MDLTDGQGRSENLTPVPPPSPEVSSISQAMSATTALSYAHAINEVREHYDSICATITKRNVDDEPSPCFVATIANADHSHMLYAGGREAYQQGGWCDENILFVWDDEIFLSDGKEYKTRLTLNTYTDDEYEYDTWVEVEFKHPDVEDYRTAHFRHLGRKDELVLEDEEGNALAHINDAKLEEEVETIKTQQDYFALWSSVERVAVLWECKELKDEFMALYKPIHAGWVLSKTPDWSVPCRLISDGLAEASINICSKPYNTYISGIKIKDINPDGCLRKFYENTTESYRRQDFYDILSSIVRPE